MKIITVTTNNLDQLVPLFNDYRIFYKQESDLAAAREFLEGRISKSESIIFMVLNQDENGLGFTQLYPSFSSVKLKPTYILNDLYVSSQHRGLGIGNALLEHAKQFSIDLDCSGISLETDIDNPAQKLYERLGWKKDLHLHYSWEYSSS
jgi:ribosomal protein S18 acetylase RimI-like enzyme